MIYLIIGLIILFVSAEMASFVFKIHSNIFYRVFHFVGGALTYLFFLNLTQNRLLSLGLVLAIGILWEIHEWILLMDILGALLFYVVELV